MLHEKTSLQVQKIRKSILKHQASRKDGQYTSFYDGNDLDGIKGIECADEIIDTIVDYSNSYVQATIDQDSNLNTKFDRSHVQLWYNVYHEGIHHCWHDHGRSLLSGTIYIHTDIESSTFDIKSPVLPLIKSWYNNFTDRWSQEIKLLPDPGDILIWPGFLEHQVKEQKACKEPRISISFNIFYKR
jgi:uncharacterized protein (TIGR02466 family)